VLAAGLASLNLLLDFDLIEQEGVRGAAPQYMEWFAGLRLLVTLVCVPRAAALLGRLRSTKSSSPSAAALRPAPTRSARQYLRRHPLLRLLGRLRSN
jgi:hypothetical protein